MIISKELYNRLIAFLRSPAVWIIKGAGQIAFDLQTCETEEVEIPVERLAVLDSGSDAII